MKNIKKINSIILFSVLLISCDNRALTEEEPPAYDKAFIQEDEITPKVDEQKKALPEPTVGVISKKDQKNSPKAEAIEEKTVALGHEDEKLPQKSTDKKQIEADKTLGIYSTYYGDSSKPRVSNIMNAAEKINGIELMPGEEFSCYEVLSPFTEENGYFPAGTYSDGKVVESMGGGVCQISSTLYNAVLGAELKITERSSHSMIVSYVDVARDAAIAGDYKDLKFKNNLEIPIIIEASAKDGKLTFTIRGLDKRKSNRTIRFETVILNKTQPGEDIVTEDENQPKGYTKVTQTARTGYEAELVKIISIDGKETDRITINTSSYEPSPQYLTIGTGSETE